MTISQLLIPSILDIYVLEQFRSFNLQKRVEAGVVAQAGEEVEG